MQKSKKIQLTIIAVTACTILGTGIFYDMPFVLMIPLFVSLFVMALNTEANRYAPLVGSLNSLLYAGVYLYLGVYMTALNAVLVSFPLQMFTFLRWKKNAYEHTVIFKKMTCKWQILVAAGNFALWMGLFVLLRHWNYEYALFDSLLFILGLLIPVLTLFAYVEYSYYNVLNVLGDFFLKIQMIGNNPQQMPYLIYSFYLLYCMVPMFINVQKYYRKQQAEKAVTKK